MFTCLLSNFLIFQVFEDCGELCFGICINSNFSCSRLGWLCSMPDVVPGAWETFHRHRLSQLYLLAYIPLEKALMRILNRIKGLNSV